MVPVRNPYAKPKENDAQTAIMGPQSQRRLTLKERTHQMQGSNVGYKKGKKGEQQTLTGEVAFNPIKDCAICKARHIGYAEPHRGHHKLCWNNKRTRGISSTTSLASIQESKHLKFFFEKPSQSHEMYTSANNSKAACEQFFHPKNPTTKISTEVPKATTAELTIMSSNGSTGEQLCFAVAERIADTSFQTKHQRKEAPLAILALAGWVVEKIVRTNDKESFEKYFQGLTMTVPPADNMHDNPHYHSIVGHKLLLVDWKRTHGVEIPCGECTGTFQNDRTNFSKNKALFPIFNIDGPPSWAMVMSMVCNCCKRRVYANESDVLRRLPLCVSASYPWSASTLSRTGTVT